MTIIKWFRLRRFRRQARRVQAMAKRFDQLMRNLSFTRVQRRQMWNDILESKDARTTMFAALAGDRS